MKKTIFSIIAVIMALAVICPSAFAREFAPVVDTSNIGVHTQYKYEENDPSWLRQLTIKEDLLSLESFVAEVLLHPVTSYPYTTDAPGFKAHVNEYVEIYTLDEDSQKAAYLYLIEQLGALSIIANPETTDRSKADWLREQGIIITEEDEKDSDKVLMINALYALMYNDFYYVIKGERLDIPKGTPLEEAVVMYLMALSDNNSKIKDFMVKFFGTASVGDFDDYVYYTSLMALYTQGYVSPLEIATISRDEVYRRVAIMTINSYGISVDAKNATTEEIHLKYLTAMLGAQFSVTLDPTTLLKALNNENVPYYILQRMAYEDAKVTISQTKYSYEKCFKLVLQKTDRFKLEDEFYSDIYEYDIYLNHKRSSIYINPNPLSKSGVSIEINKVDVTGGSYALVGLTGEAKETILITSYHTTGKNVETSVYKINVHQGTSAAPDSDLTGLVPDLDNLINNQEQTSGGSSNLPVPPLTNVLNNIGNAAAPLLNKVLILNSKGQLVDQYGNIVSDSTYETLPPGYDYVINNDGIISVVPSVSKTTEPTTEESSDKLSKTDAGKIVIIVSLVCFVLLLIAIIVVVIISKKKRPLTKRSPKKQEN